MNIKKYGFIEDNTEVHKLIAASDFGLLPFHTSLANRARWPSKISDYLINGVPIICTHISDIPEIFKTFDIGYLSNSDNNLEFAEKIKAALTASKEEYTIKSKNAYTFAIDNLLWENICKRNNTIYKSLLCSGVHHITAG